MKKIATIIFYITIIIFLGWLIFIYCKNYDDWQKKAAEGSSAYSNARDRPYTGQSHTINGERGNVLVYGLTIRDICDCIVQGMLSASTNSTLQDKCFPLDNEETWKKGDWRYDDLYKIDLSRIDPGAVMQNAACYMEKYMNIFPNIQKEIL